MAKNLEIYKSFIVTIENGVYYKGYHLGGKTGEVVDTTSYIKVKFSDFEEPINLFRKEIAQAMDEQQFYLNHLDDLFEEMDP